METTDYHYDLPDERIARYPVVPRSDARLLHWKAPGALGHHRVRDLATHSELLGLWAQVWHNVSRVIRARIYARRSTGGVLEVLLLEPVDQPVEAALGSSAPSVWRCMVRGAKRWTSGPVQALQDSGVTMDLVAVESSGTRLIRLEWTSEGALGELLDGLGTLPLPPYLERDTEPEDDERYQTIYASAPGSVAAPTAGLHFDAQVWSGIQGYASVHAVTLHVGAGTFKPLGDGGWAAHHMHVEQVILGVSDLEALAIPGVRRVAVGTTSLRSLESFFWWAVVWRATGYRPTEVKQWDWKQHAADGEGWTIHDAAAWVLQQFRAHGSENGLIAFATGIMIAPGYRIRSVEALMTNFHQPQSTLLCLVEAFVGPNWRSIYSTAMLEGYRFLSFGDASLLERWEP